MLREDSKSWAVDTYQLLDSGDFRKLEQVGPFRIVRPAASAVWTATLPKSDWLKCDAEFVRNADGSGDWKIKNPRLKDPFLISINGISFLMKLTSFGHLGIFAEQQDNWKALEKWTKTQVAAGRSVKVLNLFAYTGGSTLFCARGGAEVAHVDASKGTVRWATDNAKASNLGDKKIRWLVDDVKEFVARELRRGTQYQAVVLDPPSYGKGEKKQVWKIEKDLMPLLGDIKKLLDPTGESLICLSAHSEGYSPTSLSNQLNRTFGKGNAIESGEMLIVDAQGLALPSGATATWYGRI